MMRSLLLRLFRVAAPSRRLWLDGLTVCILLWLILCAFILFFGGCSRATCHGAWWLICLQIMVLLLLSGELTIKLYSAFLQRLWVVGRLWWNLLTCLPSLGLATCLSRTLLHFGLFLAGFEGLWCWRSSWWLLDLVAFLLPTTFSGNLIWLWLIGSFLFFSLRFIILLCWSSWLRLRSRGWGSRSLIRSRLRNLIWGLSSRLLHLAASASLFVFVH